MYMFSLKKLNGTLGENNLHMFLLTHVFAYTIQIMNIM